VVKGETIMPVPEGVITSTENWKLEAAAEAAIETEAIDEIVEEELAEPEDDMQ
jgi:hypothetical protein